VVSNLASTFDGTPCLADTAKVVTCLDISSFAKNYKSVTMVAPQHADEFISLLERSKLAPPGKIIDITNRFSLREKSNPKEVAARFIKEGLITKFQAERLLKGSIRGLVLDDYRVTEILGFGGMGMVYVAEEGATNWQVALKVLSDKYRGNDATKSRFQLEAEAGMKLDHPNIVHTRAIHETEDIYGPIHYVVMDLVKGVSLLEQILLQGALPWQQACDVILQAAAGLQHAHDEGMVHRDVKPENLLIRSNGTVKVLDFGLAMIDGSDEEFTMAMIHGQDCLGTADYVAPEQTVNSYDIDARADIYGLGCTFYAALTAKLPFPAKTNGEKILGHRTKQARSIREISPSVPEKVDLFVRKMMAKRPENRFATANELIQHLEPLAERRDVEFDFPSILRWRSRQAKRRAEEEERKEAATAKDTTLSQIDARASTSGDRFEEDTIVGQDTQLSQRAAQEDKQTS
jgi:serine/threonine protein kinase